jgi:hypothetical protein
MSFRTEYQVDALPFFISHGDRISLIGSCFAEHFATKFEHFGFRVCGNPFGVIFNPISISHILHQVAESNFNFFSSAFDVHQGVHFNYLVHSKFYHAERELLHAQLHSQSLTLHRFLNEGSTLFVTLGTAFAYQHKKLKCTVANCHKMPAQNFTKKLLSVTEIVRNFSACLDVLKSLNPQLQVVFTVSPVRHLKDGFHENQLSKATLLLSIHQLIEKHENAHYFPAYELLMDDLRDYRFYTDDMLHPNDTAVNYIWKKLEQSIFKPSTQYLNAEIDKLRLAKNHKAIQPNSEQHKKFEAKLIQQWNEFSKKHPEVYL